MRRSVWISGWVGSVLVLGYVDQLKDEGASSDDAAAAWEEVPANNVFENGGLASGLRTDNNLGKVLIHILSALHIASVDLTIWGRSRESLPMVLNTRSCSLLTVESRSSPRAAIAAASWEPFLFFFALVSTWVRRSQTTQSDEATGMIQQR